MKWTSILAIYPLFWVLCTFMMLPVGMRTAEEVGQEQTPGQADSAPADFRPGIVLIRGTILSIVIFGIYYLNYVYGWISADTFAFSRR